MSQEKEWMLRAVSPDLFKKVTSDLEKYNIHLNDIQANAVKKDDGLDVIILFGESFNQFKSHFFTYDEIDSNDVKVSQFINEVAEACKDIMIADYFKMMKP